MGRGGLGLRRGGGGGGEPGRTTEPGAGGEGCEEADGGRALRGRLVRGQEWGNSDADLFSPLSPGDASASPRTFLSPEIMFSLPKGKNNCKLKLISLPN